MANFAKKLAQDVAGQVRYDAPPPFVSRVSYQKDNAVASSVISLNPNSTEVEISSVNGSGIVIRWVPLTETAAVSPFGSVIASGLTANFDHFIAPALSPRRFIIPKETMGQTIGGQIGSVNGLYQRIAWINVGISASSIVASEF